MHFSLAALAVPLLGVTVTTAGPTAGRKPWLLSRSDGADNQTAPACRAVPGSSDWPAAAAWTALNSSVDGRLIRAVPPGQACHLAAERETNTTRMACAALKERWSDEFFHSSDPVSVEWNTWTNDSCLPDPTLPCSGQGYPVYVINATTAEHVKAGVDFARNNNVRLIVKNSGHDYVGRSVGPYALSIWVHYMKGITLHPTSFAPRCSNGSNISIAGAALTALAGTQMLEAYAATGAINHTVIGGNGRTVALGGFITGAGHSILAPQFGLATDQVLEMEVVTPQGEIVTANECQNEDVFWAMRGGGGSTFGVLTSVTMKIIPSPEVAAMTFWIGTEANNTQAFEMLTYVVSQFPTLADAGISGYPILFNTVPNFIDGTNSFIKGMIGKIMLPVMPGGVPGGGPGAGPATTGVTFDAASVSTAEAANATLVAQIQRIFGHINATWTRPLVYGHFNTSYYANFQAWYADNYDPSPTGHENLMSSRLLDRAALTADLPSLEIALAKFSAAGQATVYIVSGPAVHAAQPRGGGNAILPAWRSTYVHSTTSLNYTGSDKLEAAKKLTGFFSAAMRDLAPDTGAYMNEASKFESDWQKTFWGDNYPRLLQIKRAIDPTDVFWCTPCVGSERWEEQDDGQLCRVDD